MGLIKDAAALVYYKQAGLQLRCTAQTAYHNSTRITAAVFTNLPVITADYYSSHLGFFCKKEIQLEKITKVPFKFRLGSVQQCDRLEGKTTAPMQ